MSVINRALQDLEARHAPAAAGWTAPHLPAHPPAPPRRLLLWLLLALLTAGGLLGPDWAERRVTSPATDSFPSAQRPPSPAESPSGTQAGTQTGTDTSPAPAPKLALADSWAPALDLSRLRARVPARTLAPARALAKPAGPRIDPPAESPLAEPTAPDAASIARSDSQRILAAQADADLFTLIDPPSGRPAAVSTAAPAFSPLQQARDLAASGRDHDALQALQLRAALPLPSEAEALGLQAGLLTRLGRHAEAVTAYEQALRRQPAQATWWMGLGLALTHTGQPQQAREAYAQARSLGTLTPDLQAWLDQQLAAR